MFDNSQHFVEIVRYPTNTVHWLFIWGSTKNNSHFWLSDRHCDRLGKRRVCMVTDVSMLYSLPRFWRKLGIAGWYKHNEAKLLEVDLLVFASLEQEEPLIVYCRDKMLAVINGCDKIPEVDGRSTERLYAGGMMAVTEQSRRDGYTLLWWPWRHVVISGHVAIMAASYEKTLSTDSGPHQTAYRQCAQRTLA